MVRVALVGILLVGLIQQVLVAPSVELKLVTSLRAKSTTNIIISMKDSPRPVLNEFHTRDFHSRGDRLNTIAYALKAYAANSQRNVMRHLEAQAQNKPMRMSVFWITNQIAVRGADMELVEQLSTFPEISKIEEEFFIQLDQPLDLQVMDDLPLADEEEVQWGVKQIKAPEVWTAGNKGQGIIIGTVDTGARLSHEALRDNYVGEYGWFDPGSGTAEPNDGNGHGTHTTANIAGTTRNVGVAPGAKWVACKGCAFIFCSQIDLMECGHFMACPHKPDGTDADCTKAPHLVSNSWGGGQGNTWYYDIVDYYYKVKIIPLFSAGNSGPSCGTANSPGDYDNLIGVGSTDISNSLSYFSSVGPTVDGRMKPDVAAPGSNVFSAYHTSDTAYASMSGTSMACPHAAGVVALILSENRNVTYEYVKEILQGGGEGTTSTGLNCGDIPETEYPNHHVGHGRINAFNSIKATKALFKRK